VALVVHWGRRACAAQRRSFVVTAHEATHWDTLVDLIAAFHVVETPRPNRSEGHVRRRRPRRNGAGQSAASARVDDGVVLFGLREAGVEIFGSLRGFAGLASLFEAFPSGSLGVARETIQGSTNQFDGCDPQEFLSCADLVVEFEIGMDRDRVVLCRPSLPARWLVSCLCRFFLLFRSPCTCPFG